MSGKRGPSSGDPSKRERKKQRTEQTRQKIKEAVDLFFGSPDYRRLNKSRGLRAPLVDLFREKERLRGKYLNEIPSPGASVEYELSENGEIFLEFLEEKIREEWQTAKFINLDSSDESEDDVVFVREEMRKPEPRPANRAGRQSESDDDDGKQPVVEPKRRTRAAPTNANPSLVYFRLKWLPEGRRLPEKLKDSLAAVANVENASFAKEWEKSGRQANAQRRIDGGTVTVNTFQTRNLELAARLDVIGVQIPTRNAEKEQGEAPAGENEEALVALASRFLSNEALFRVFASAPDKDTKLDFLKQWLDENGAILGKDDMKALLRKLGVAALERVTNLQWLTYYIFRNIPDFAEGEEDTFLSEDARRALQEALGIQNGAEFQRLLDSAWEEVSGEWAKHGEDDFNWPQLVGSIDQWASEIYPNQFEKFRRIRSIGEGVIDKGHDGTITDLDKAIVEYFALQYMLNENGTEVRGLGELLARENQGIDMLRRYLIPMPKQRFQSLLKETRAALNAKLKNFARDVPGLAPIDFAKYFDASAETARPSRRLQFDEGLKPPTAKEKRAAAEADERLKNVEQMKRALLGDHIEDAFGDDEFFYLDRICGSVFQGGYENEDYYDRPDDDDDSWIEDDEGEAAENAAASFSWTIGQFQEALAAYVNFMIALTRTTEKESYYEHRLTQFQTDADGALIRLAADARVAIRPWVTPLNIRTIVGLQAYVIGLIQGGTRAYQDKLDALFGKEGREEEELKYQNRFDVFNQVEILSGNDKNGVNQNDVKRALDAWTDFNDREDIRGVWSQYASEMLSAFNLDKDENFKYDNEEPAFLLLLQMQADDLVNLLVVPPLERFLAARSPRILTAIPLPPAIAPLRGRDPEEEPTIVRHAERTRVALQDLDELDAMLSDEVWSSGHGRRRVPIGAWRKPQVSLPKVGKREVLPVPPWRRNLPAASATVAPWQWVLYFLLLVGTADIPDVVYDKVAWRLYIDDPDEKAAALAAAQDAARLVFAENDGGFARSFARLVFQRPEDKKISGAMRELSGHDPSEDDMVVTSRNPPAAESRQAEPDSPPPAPRPRGARIAPVDLDADVAAALILSHGDLEEAFALLNIQ